MLNQGLAVIRIGIDPLLQLGPFTLDWHGILTVLAVVGGVWVGLVRARRAGIPDDATYSVALWGILGGIIGSRLFHVIDYWDYYLQNPRAIFSLEGTALYGAILGGAFGGAIYVKLRGLPLGKLADVAAPGLLVAQVIGRIGCLINGDAYGTPTSLPWGIVYTHPNAAATTILGIPGHPAPFYEIIWDLLVLGVILRWRLRPDGATFLLYLTLYSLGRFFISLARVNIAILWGLQQAQLIALMVMGFSLPFLLYLTLRERRKLPISG